MKKNFSLLLAIVILFSYFNISSVSAASENNKIYLDDGYYIITEAISENNLSEIVPMATTKSASRSSKLYDENDQLLVTFTINATFSVNTGLSVRCTGVSYTKTIASTNWSFVSASTSKNNTSASQASATATGIFKDTKTGKQVSIPVTVSCTKAGLIF